MPVVAGNVAGPRHDNMRRLLVLHGLGGPRPEIFVPRIARVADLWLVFDARLGNAEHFIEVGVSSEQLSGARGSADTAVRALQLAGEAGNVAGVLTFSETMLAPAAEIAAHLGLRFHSPDAVVKLQNKYEQRVALEAASIPGPRFAPIGEVADLPRAAARVGFPAVFKPVYGAASTLVFRIGDEDELCAAFATAVDYWRRADMLGGHGELLRDRPVGFVLEELIQGEDWHGDDRLADFVSVETLLVNGEPTHLTVTDKLPLVWPFRETGDVMPSSLPDERQDEIRDVTSAALRAIGARHGFTHTEIKLTPSGPQVIEVNGRIGGGVAENLWIAAGFDVTTPAGLVAMGEPVDLDLHFAAVSGCLLLQRAADSPGPSPDTLWRLEELSGVVSVYGGFPDEPWQLGGGRVATVYVRAGSADEVIAVQAAAQAILDAAPRRVE